MLDTTKAIREESGMIGGMKNEESGMKGGMKNEESGTIDEESGTKIKTVNRILALISKNNAISISQLSTDLGINRSAIQKHIDNMKNNGIIRREGADKGGKWVIINLKN